jgi:hypothetical protein
MNMLKSRGPPAERQTALQKAMKEFQKDEPEIAC